eukprot:CAMPEP_0179301414 /NCGR_PEP_ID=MMETSP0797-20121207/47540_1 /TAXON_ID=47934 /ORGANISM="Dinophysis acuminata, Strain DAEP01" /LENGTH=246 /DNA_ID=CAMNT_0021010919 /DNA_START=23 /DNA_END=765 /DNA_ORIENTATION=+
MTTTSVLEEAGTAGSASGAEVRAGIKPSACANATAAPPSAGGTRRGGLRSSATALLEAPLLVHVRVAAANRPEHLFPDRDMAIPELDHGPARDEELRRPGLAALHDAVHSIEVVEHWIDLVDVLAVLEVLVDAQQVPRVASAPPGVVCALGLQVVHDLDVLVGPLELVLPRVVDGAEAAPRNGPVAVDTFHFYEPLHEIEPAKIAGDHERRSQVLVEWRVLVCALLDEIVDLGHVALDGRLLEPEL